MEMPDVTDMQLDFIPFFMNFAHNWRRFMSEVLYFHQTFKDCLSIHLFWYVDMPDVATSYGRFPDLIGFFGNSNVWYVKLWK